MSNGKGLASGVLGTASSIIMGVAGTAPAYSVAATAAALVAAVGVLSVGSLFYCGIVMFGLMYAYVHLDKMESNAGASYTWVGRVFGKTWGFFAGWALMVASVIFMVSATVPAATSTLALVAPDLVENTTWVAIVAALWLTLVTLVVTKGIKHASVAQITFTILETGIIVALIVGGFYQYWGQPMHAPSIAWFDPTAFTFESFIQGALIAVFFYWGWDVTMSLGEETKGGRPKPTGQGAFWAMINLILMYIILMIVVLIVLTDEEIQQASSNILLAVSTKLFPEPWNYVGLIVVMLSTVGTLETQILCFTRSIFAMARDKVVHNRYAVVHPEWQTPYIANIMIWLMGLILLFASSYMPSVNSILEASILSIGLQICFYLGLAGLACAWYYRKAFGDGPWAGLTHVVWPGLSAAFMIFIAAYTIYDVQVAEVDPENPPVVVYGVNLVNIIGIGAILLGFVPLALNRLRRK